MIRSGTMAWLNDGELPLERCRAPVGKRATNNYALLLLDVSLRCWSWILKYDGGSGSSLRDVTVTAAGRSVGILSCPLPRFAIALVRTAVGSRELRQFRDSRS